ncbi:PhoX family phosphatase [uncultured Algimonas sp.]|uniref:PhoX family protein n=1 Tax=uncultured Algimonas sp. TaxID=1547920 RepID=UPI00262E036A|nr:PhoX family phosphatase [uncultured Algimonas sp.]
MNDSENITSNPRMATGTPSISDIVDARLSRRGLLGGLAAVSALTVTGCASGLRSRDTEAPAFTFAEIERGMDDTHHVPGGYRADVMLRWGDALFADSPAFDPKNQSEASQLRQFGYNNDYIGFVALPDAADGTKRGLLCVNHEYTTGRLMFPGIMQAYPESMTEDLCRIEMAAHGGTVVEISETTAGWQPVVGSRYNRRITAHATPMTLTGPAAGSPRLVTTEDPTGRTVAGTMNNCAGGITPWGTYLMAEENFNGNFLGDVPAGHPEAENHDRYGVPGRRYQWGRFVDRYDVGREPNEPNRFGWVVEVDPMDPASTPKKRTALGRYKHEGAETVVAPDGRVVIYMGDDQRFDYVYKFVTRDRLDPADRNANRDMLDHGTLYVARFDANGVIQWMPLIHGQGPLTAENGFASQADVLIETRRAADLLEATPMDRPEDVEPDPASGSVWVMLTNNHRRQADQVGPANPRAENRTGHIIEIKEPDGDFAATQSRWEILVRCGDPSDPSVGAVWNPLTSENGWFGSPDNCAVDPSGRLWVATDGNERTGAADGVWAMETTGERRGTGKAFFRAPIGAEVCGPKFAPDGRTLFVAVQHPGDGEDATFENPTTRWPDFQSDVPPRPSVMALKRADNAPIGT